MARGALRLNASAKAPGRLDLMGGFAGEAGSLVLELALPLGARATVTLTDEPRFVARSGRASVLGLRPEVAFPLETLLPSLGALGYEQARALFRREEAAWAAHVLGGIVLLAREKKAILDRGAIVEIESDVPADSGLGACAAIEVAAIRAILRAYGATVTEKEIARLAQRVSHLIAGSPSELREPLAAVFGREGHLLPIVCRPGEVREPVPIPEGIDFLCLDAGTDRTQGATAPAASVRAAIAIGFRILSSKFPGHRYLTELGVHALEGADLPDRMTGRDFLAKWRETSDPSVRVEPEAVYPVRAATQHPIRENERSAAFLFALRRYASSADCAELGKMGERMFESHASLSACGLGFAEIDSVVEAMRALGPARGVFGAKGAGEGERTVAVLVTVPQGRRVVEEWAAAHPSIRIVCGCR